MTFPGVGPNDTSVRYRLAIVLLVASLSAACRGGAKEAPVFHGVRLGMAPKDVRERFDQKGTWGTAATKELTLTWNTTEAQGPVATAQFEFHNGMLVAVRSDVAPVDPLVARGFAVTDSSVTDCQPGIGTRKTCRILARDCADHAEEVKALMSAH